MAAASSTIYRPRLSARVEGVPDALPVIQFAATFELNAIPRGSLAIATGREFRSGNPSPVHTLAAALGAGRKRVVVTLDPGGQGGPGDGLNLPAGPFTVFDGFAEASGASMAGGVSRCDMQLVHWLDDLNFSSVYSKTSHPANPGDFTYGALGGGKFGVTSVGPGVPGRHWVSTTHAVDHFDAAAVQADLWGESLLGWITALCEDDAFQSDELPAATGPQPNSQALAALARIGGGACALPLALDLAVDADMASTLAAAVTKMTEDPEEFAHVTIWDAIVGKFASEFLFAVVPLVDRALVVPFVPGYRTAFRVIPARHGTQVQWTRQHDRTLRGVGVLAGTDLITGAGFGTPNAGYNVGTGGFYSPDPDGPGQVQIRGGPSWLARYSAPRYSPATTGVAGSPIPNALAPGIDPNAAAGGAAATVAAQAARVQAVKGFLDRYAQALYAIEATRGRQAIAAGPLRFDVAPGSTVIVYPGGRSGIEDDALRAPIFGTVLRTSIQIDAEGGAVGTSFHLGNCRTEDENATDRASIAGHPLYRDTFAGCSLV